MVGKLNIVVGLVILSMEAIIGHLIQLVRKMQVGMLIRMDLLIYVSMSGPWFDSQDLLAICSKTMVRALNLLQPGRYLILTSTIQMEILSLMDGKQMVNALGLRYVWESIQ